MILLSESYSDDLKRCNNDCCDRSVVVVTAERPLNWEHSLALRK